ncbi:ABC transporter permease subunit [Ruminococcaceae bacterium OttesenSCG-928-L11]|nr:ABC transporter permease subunit [Ruminococcaceae bacterium OttesenSCG-928-L11]
MSGPGQTRAARRRDFWKRFHQTKALYLFIIPGILFYAIFKYYPIYGSQIAFRDYSPYLGFWNSEWVGLANFQRFFSSPDFLKIIQNTLVINLTALVIGFPFPILLALMLNQVTNQRFKKTVQTITYAPYFISTVVMVGMLYTMLSPYSGVINVIIKKLGGEAVFFMGNKSMYVPIYVLSGVWQTSGWSAVVYIAALSGVSEELHEAATVDGAGRLRRIWHIDLPGITPTIVTMLILTAGQMLSIGFEKSNLMQNAINIDVAEVISTYTYKRGLINGDFSYASAVELFQSAINFGILVAVNKLSQKLNETSLW